MSAKKNKDFDKRIFKKSSEELEMYMYFKKRGFSIQNRKGKGSFKRKSKYRKYEDSMLL